jgi:hypothetical protein
MQTVIVLTKVCCCVIELLLGQQGSINIKSWQPGECPSLDPDLSLSSELWSRAPLFFLYYHIACHQDRPHHYHAAPRSLHIIGIGGSITRSFQCHVSLPEPSPKTGV